VARRLHHLWQGGGGGYLQAQRQELCSRSVAGQALHVPLKVRSALWFPQRVGTVMTG
jgi:hypothetical protein